MGGKSPFLYIHMKNKLKILMCSEASFINSGFGTYSKELLSRLYDTNKYDLAEFASYGYVNDPRDSFIKWKYYANAVKENDPRYSDYNSRTDNQFGRWRFEKTLIDFKPDVVFDVRDYWMSSYQRYSPLRPFFHWVLMPTVDSAPQQEEWIDTFLNADAIFTYSDWGAKVLLSQSSNKINYIDTVSPGIDPDIFKIKNRVNIRQQMNIPQDAFIVGSVMRNQKRKLLPELFVAFRKALDILERSDKESIANKTFLYLHTSYPDMGWDIPELLKQHRLSNKVIFSYICKNCSKVSCSKFQGPMKVCSSCYHNYCALPSVTSAFSTEQLSNTYNIFDLYVQYAICEGFGMPQVEAGACGVPIATVNYSAMCDIVEKLEAYPIKVKSYFREIETKADRVYPDNNDLAKYIVFMASKSKEELDSLRQKVSKLTHEKYNWDSTSKKWEKYFDKLDKSGYRANWTAPHPLSTVTKNKIEPKEHFNAMFNMLNSHVQNPNMIGDQKILEILNAADYGFVQHGITNISPYNFSSATDFIDSFIKNHNVSVSILNNNTKLNEDFIRYAHLKNKL
jgi:glycosyltransferase involved in cell wall biosynthesis